MLSLRNQLRRRVRTSASRSPLTSSFSTVTSLDQAEALNSTLKTTDPTLYNIIEQEKNRQRTSLCLIASENFTSRSVFEALGSVMSNKYSEGYPGARYYGGNEFIDEVENLCRDRALEAFHLDPEEWGVNVQSLSGSPANFQVYTAVLEPHDRIMSLDLPHGGHLSHGFQTPQKKISAVSKYFESLPYRLNEETGTIDYDKMEELAEYYRPKLIVAGASAYARLIDYERIRNIADQHNAYVLGDMAHISGLVAAQLIPSPFEHCDIVTTTTHKSLRGPRGAMIFYRKGVRSENKKTGKKVMYDLESKVDFSVFPGHQGGPHNHTIAALSTALLDAKSAEFVDYQKRVMANSSACAEELQKRGYNLVSGGTSNHLMLVDLKNSPAMEHSMDGARVERVLELANIATNKNTVPGDKSALVPGGLRIGTPAMSSRGLTEEDFVTVAQLIDRGCQLAKNLKDIGAKGQVGAGICGPKLKDFRGALEGANIDEVVAKAPTEVKPIMEDIQNLRNDVASFAETFPVVGQFDYPEIEEAAEGY
eukprot:g1411.t1